jgi:hypothetical protein
LQEKSTARYALLGSGRVATHFRFYLNRLGFEVRQWSRTLEKVPGPELVQTLRDATHILVLVKDDAIEPLVEKAKELLAQAGIPPKQTWVHFSGSLQTQAAWGAHPLMSFAADRLFEPDFYRSIPFIIDQGSPPFAQILPGFENPSYRVDPSKRPLYHALCVMGGNFTVMLWQKVLKDFEEKLLIPGRAAFPIFEACLQNLKLNANQALTGPLVRGDEATLAKNTDALEGDAFQNVYRAFVEAYQRSREKLK